MIEEVIKDLLKNCMVFDYINKVLEKYSTCKDYKIFHETVDMLCKKGVACGVYQNTGVLVDVVQILSYCEEFIKEKFYKNMTDQRLLELKKALLEGIEAAKKYAQIKDDGFCNFDKIELNLDICNKKIEDVIVECGFIVSKSRTGGYVICGNTSGHANRQTKMTEVICETLCSYGFESSMLYEID